MYRLNQIRRTLHEGRVELRSVVDPEDSRAGVARRVCEAFGFRDARGRLQQASCTAVLRELDEAGLIRLPPPRNRGGGGGRPRGLGHAVPLPADVPDRVDQVARLRLILVETTEQRRLWTEMVAREHARGAACHAGHQLRYLIGSAHGWLGAVGFAAPAQHLAARDAWIGWDRETRAQHLHRVLGMSRFLIRTPCRNLASKALGLCLRTVTGDFEKRYGYRPLLVETFVDLSRHDGASLRAANWQLAGESAGRGRRARPGAPPVGVKAIYMYALDREWRRLLGVPAPVSVPLDPADGLDRESWAENEFGGAPLGDKRLTRRLVTSAAVQAEHPGSSFVSAAQGRSALVSGYYRMIEHPDESAVNPENILAAHRQRTLQRMQGQDVALCIQDGSDLNFATRPSCKNLGIISKNRNSSGTLGLHMHTTLVANDDGLPLGIPRIEYDAPDGTSEKNKPPEDRKTQRTGAAGLTCRRARRHAGGDGKAISCSPFSANSGMLLVRAKHDRKLGKDLPKLFDKVRAEPVRQRLEIHIERSSARNSARGQKAKDGREARDARVALRWCMVDLPAPARKTEPVRLTLVHVKEEEDPGGEALEWFLLTTLPVTSCKEALQVLEWYRLRWRIEDWHKVLKCEVEEIAHRTAERIKRAVTLNAVIAWRLAVMTLLGRETPELPAEVMFSDVGVLRDFATDRKLPEPLDLGTAVLTMAMLGGYLKRKRDGPPGYKVIWVGNSRLNIMVQAYELRNRVAAAEPHHQLRPDKTCD